ncbi:hypothetical protein EVAR_29595_1 [Eumeta japonica]|uniref:Uncharacterized protein n=1 Tax=Eumeta variegata TaxID=151549 RepID=A0A4C1VVV9_EUMVA|nr:hypothetical protein EVAR_29595_1 [Eumeta japonica]
MTSGRCRVSIYLCMYRAAAARNLGERRASAHANLELVYLITAFVPSLMACFTNSPGSSRRTEVCTSLDVIEGGAR